MVPLVRGGRLLETAFGALGFMEWFEWLNPCVRGLPGVLRTFGMVSQECRVPCL